MRTGIVSDIRYQLAPHFDHYGLAQFVDSYTLSFEHGVQKPHPRLFEITLEQLGVTAAESLMVGDRASRDGGAAAVGITTLILPPVPNYTPRGLDIVLHLLQCTSLRFARFAALRSHPSLTTQRCGKFGSTATNCVARDPVQI